MATVAVLIAVLLGPLVAAFIAVGKGRGPIGWGALTFFAPILLAPFGASAYVIGVVALVVLVAVLPRRGAFAGDEASASDWSSGLNAAQRRRFAKLRKRLRRSRPGDAERESVARELAALDSVPAARILLEDARRRQEPTDPAWTALGGMSSPPVVDEVCRAWDSDPRPELEAIIRGRGLRAGGPPRLTLATSLLAGLPAGEASHLNDRVDLLVELLRHKSSAVQTAARTALISLTSAGDVDRFCGIAFREPADQALWGIATEAGYLASGPADVRVKSALLTGQTAVAVAEDAGALAALVALTRADDAPLHAPDDALWRAPALDALRGLRVPQQSDLLCGLALEQARGEDVLALCRELGFVPSTPTSRAVFYVLAGQFDLYEGLDPDGTVLQAGYADLSGPAATRLRQVLLRAGRAALLQQVLTHELSVEELVYTPGEASFVVDQLSARRDWRRLAEILPALPMAEALRAARAIPAEELPVEEGGRSAAVARLCGLARQTTLSGRDLEDGRVPALVQVAALHVRAHINDLVFSADGTLVAIALGDRRAVVLWDYSSGAQSTVVRGFRHSVGRVAFGDGGRIYCAEKTSSTTTPCALYVASADARPAELGTHAGSITSLSLLDERRLVTTGRDALLTVWPLPSSGDHAVGAAVEGEAAVGGTAKGAAADGGVGRFPLQEWARQACVLKAGERIVGMAVAARDLTVVDLETGVSLAAVPLRDAGGATALALAPSAADADPETGSGTLVVGTTRGSLLRVDFASPPPAATRTPAPAVGAPAAAAGTPSAAARTPAPVTCTLREVLPGRPHGAVSGLEWLDAGALCVAWADGHLEILSWPDGRREWESTADVEKITSSAISSDGRLLALGDGDTRSVLFDTRGRRLRSILLRPANGCSPLDWACVRSLRAGKDLAEDLTHTLAFVDQLLEDRFGDDVVLAEGAPVAHGDFDIAIDDET